MNGRKRMLGILVITCVLATGMSDRHQPAAALDQTMKELNDLIIREEQLIARIEAQSNESPFRAAIECKERYQIGQGVTCRFSITNQAVVDYMLLKRNTPLEGMFSEHLSVSQDRKKIQYRGILGKRLETPLPDEYVLLKSKGTEYVDVDIADSYVFDKSAQYTVQLRTEVMYYVVQGDQQPSDGSPSNPLSTPLVSDPVTFTMEGVSRDSSVSSQFIFKCQRPDDRSPCDPTFVRGTASDRELTKQINRAAYHYIKAMKIAIVDDRQHYERWFGKYDQDRHDKVSDTIDLLIIALENNVLNYVFDNPKCKPDSYAFTKRFSKTINLCSRYKTTKDVLGVDTKTETIVHELVHTVGVVLHPEVYGRQNCLDLSRDHPEKAVINAENYGYFAETMNIFDYGFDSISVLPNQRTYVTRGNIYIRYSDTSGAKIDSGYPALIHNSWGTLPDSFTAGFDSIVVPPNGKIYVTKGDMYVRYSDQGGDTVDSGYPDTIQGHFGDIPASFRKSFDGMAKLGNGKTYVTNGNQYIRYSDNSLDKVDSGYPASLQGHWGSLSASFASGFDSVTQLRDGKTYVTKDKQYIRYSDDDASTVDAGFPLNIRGNWGTLSIPGPH